MLWQYVYGIDHLKVPPGSPSAILQWVIIGGIPVAFLIGCFIVHKKRQSLYTIMDKLYGECELQKQLMQTNGVHANDTKRVKVSNIQSILPDPSALRVIKRSQFVSLFTHKHTRTYIYPSALRGIKRGQF
jgi:hypothetical protein